MSAFSSNEQESSSSSSELPFWRRCEAQLSARDQHFEQLRVYMPPQGDCAGVAANSQLLAYIDAEGSGSCLGVLPLTSTGKNHVPINSPAYKQPIIRAHSQPVQDICFHQFRRDTLFSCSTDRTIKIWQVPAEGLLVDQSSAAAVFGMKSKSAVRGLAAHPTATSLLAARGSRELSLFDISNSSSDGSAPAEVFSLSDGFAGDLLSMNWSSLGDLLLTTSKDRMLRCFDPRLPASSGAVAAVAAHDGSRFMRSQWLGVSSPHFLTVGHNNSQEREIKVWDVRYLDRGSSSSGSPVLRHRVDTGGAGSLLPLFDCDLQLLVLLGKGDATLRLYEVQGSSGIIGSADAGPAAIAGSEVATAAAATAAVVVSEICSSHIGETSTDVTRGGCLLPKQANDRRGGELLRVLKLADGAVQPLHVRVQQQQYRDELFPPTLCECEPAATAAEWLAGSNARPSAIVLPPPPAVAVDDGFGSSSSSSSMAIPTAAAADSELSAADAELADHDDRRSRLISRRLSALGSASKYRNMYGREFVKEQTYFDLSPDLSCIDSALLACNAQYWALPYRGGGGPVYVATHAEVGKVAAHCATINGHKAPVQDMHFSPFHCHLLATGSADSTVKIWSVESAFGGESKATAAATAGAAVIDNPQLAELQPLVSFTNHRNSIRTCCFHPTVSQLLCTSSQDLTLRFFDAEAAREVSCLEIPEAVTVNKSFNYDGTMLAVAGKDRQFRIVDPRLGRVVSCTSVGAELSPSNSSRRVSAANFGIGRNLRVLWCASHNRISNNSNSGDSVATSWGTDPICTVSSSSSGLRQLQFWDPRHLDAGPVCSRAVDNASGQLFPLFDEDMNAVLVAGKGDTIMRMYHIQYLHPALAPTAATATVDTAAAVDTADATEQQQQKEAAATSEARDTEEGGAVEPISREKLLPLVVEKCTEFQSGREPIAGLALLPKRALDVRGVEVARVLKLTTDAVTPITFRVPRSEHLKEYFHDDLFPPTRSQRTFATVPDWEASIQEVQQQQQQQHQSEEGEPDARAAADSIFAPLLESLRPDGMVTVAEKPPAPAPSVSRSSVRVFRDEIKKAEEEAQQREDNFARLQQLAVQNAQYNKNKSGPVKIGGVVVSKPDSESDDSDAGWSDED